MYIILCECQIFHLEENPSCLVPFLLFLLYRKPLSTQWLLKKCQMTIIIIRHWKYLGGTRTFSLVIKFLSVMDYQNGLMVDFFAPSLIPQILSTSHAEQGQAVSSIPGEIPQVLRLMDRVDVDEWLLTVSSSNQSLRVREREMEAMKRLGFPKKLFPQNSTVLSHTVGACHLTSCCILLLCAMGINKTGQRISEN